MTDSFITKKDASLFFLINLASLDAREEKRHFSNFRFCFHSKINTNIIYPFLSYNTF